VNAGGQRRPIRAQGVREPLVDARGQDDRGHRPAERRRKSRPDPVRQHVGNGRSAAERLGQRIDSGAVRGR
jgi:hypothetical protein